MSNLIHLLYFEDDSAEIELARVALQRACPGLEAEMRVVSDGEEALALLSDLPVKPEHHPDIIMTDLHLPRVSGVEVIRKLRSIPAFKDIPVIVLTGAISPVERKQLSELNVAHVLSKPFTLSGYDKIFRDICELAARTKIR